MVNRTIYLFLCTLLIVSALAGGAAQAGKAGKKAEAAKPVPIDAAHMVVLTQTAVIALNQANLTGNYTVLRDYASRPFHASNTATDLAALMQRVRAERLNLLPVLTTDPVIERSDVSLDGRIIRLSGRFPVSPRPITFDLEFLNEDGIWRIYGLSVGAIDPPAPSQESGADDTDR